MDQIQLAKDGSSSSFCEHRNET